MRRWNGGSWERSAAAAALLAIAAASPVSAADPQRITGGGDDPRVVVEASADEVAIIRWKLEMAAQLREAARRSAQPRTVPRPGYLDPCLDGCTPDEFVLESYSRQQNNGYYCGPATAQVIINRTRRYFFADPDGTSAATNYKRQGVIAEAMGTDANGSTAWMVKRGLNEYADIGASGRDVPFTVLDDLTSGSDFHWAMIFATWSLGRGAAAPVQMTYSSGHLASWSNATWWSRNKGTTIRHWISIFGYSGFWDGTNAAQLFYTDSSGGYGGQTGRFQNASKLLFGLNQANSGRIVY